MEKSSIVSDLIETIVNELENYSPVNQRKILGAVNARIESRLNEKIVEAEEKLKEAHEMKELFLHGAPQLCADA